MKSNRGPFTGRYLFHLHTNYTDGVLTANQLFEEAKRHDIEKLILLEHIRKQPKYDVRAYLADIRHASEANSLPFVVGFEAKVLPDGTLDISDEHLQLADVLGIAEHGFPGDRDALVRSIRQIVESYPPRWPDKKFVWVHPGLGLRKRGGLQDDDPEYLSLLSFAQSHQVFVERSLRYGLAPASILDRLEPSQVVVGADAHTLEDLQRCWQQFDEPMKSTSLGMSQ